jgi:RNA polymerase sigma-70 factor, ECF subfamily
MRSDQRTSSPAMASEGRIATVNDEILDRAIRGDSVALDALMRAYEETVFKFAFRVCRNEERAKETVQETFVNVIRKLSQFDRRSSFTTWLYAVVTNNCLMQRRKEVQDERLESMEVSTVSRQVLSIQAEERAEDAVLNNELKGKLDEAIQALPLDYRIVFVLRDLEELSAEETAQVLKLSIPAVKSRLRRARVFLRDRLGDYVEGKL